MPLQVPIAKLTPWRALLAYPFCWIQMSTVFPALFVRGTIFKKFYSFSLRLTVSLLLRGSLQRKPGFLWCIPKCLRERNRSGAWINPASSACQKNSMTLYCWYMPRCTGCGWSLLLLLLLHRDLFHNVCSNQIKINAGGCCENGALNKLQHCSVIPHEWLDHPAGSATIIHKASVTGCLINTAYKY